MTCFTGAVSATVNCVTEPRGPLLPVKAETHGLDCGCLIEQNSFTPALKSQLFSTVVFLHLCFLVTFFLMAYLHILFCVAVSYLLCKYLLLLSSVTTFQV